MFAKKEDEIIKPLCITLPQISGFIKYFYVGKKMSFMTDEEEHIAALQANKIWKKIEKTLGVKLDSNPMFEERCIKTKLKTYNNRVNTVFLDTKNLNNEIPEEKTHYSCIAVIGVESVINVNKENYPQVY